jgi:toxin ParE1/3/4
MRVIWSRLAIEHFVALREFIEKDSDESAARVAQRILESVALLETQPAMGRPGRIVGTRELVVPGTPFLVPYRVKGDQLELLAVFHGRQRWPTKL